MAGGNMPSVRRSRNKGFPRPHALRWTVAHFCAFPVCASCAVNLYQHGIINFRPEGALNGAQIGAVPIRGQLDATGEPSGQIVHKMVSRPGATVANKPAWD